MFTLIGKMYSLESKRVRNHLDKKKIMYTYIDLELSKDAELYLKWIKAYKILSIPILKTEDNAFIVGDNLTNLDAFIERHRY